MVEAILLGAIAGEVLRAILRMKDKAINFRNDLEELESTLQYVVPLFEEETVLNLLNDPRRMGLKEMIKKLQKGQKLIEKCCEVHSWDLIRKINYSRKIFKLKNSIHRFCQQELQVDIWLCLLQQRQTQIVKNGSQPQVGTVPTYGFTNGSTVHGIQAPSLAYGMQTPWTVNPLNEACPCTIPTYGSTVHGVPGTPFAYWTPAPLMGAPRLEDHLPRLILGLKIGGILSAGVWINSFRRKKK